MKKVIRNAIYRQLVTMLLIMLLVTVCMPIASAEKIVLSDKTYQEVDHNTISVKYTGSQSFTKTFTLYGIVLTPAVSNPTVVQIYGVAPASYVTNYASLPQSQNSVFDVYTSNKKGDLITYYGKCEYGYFKTKVNDVEYLNIWYEPYEDCNFGLIDSTAYLKFTNPETDFIYPIIYGKSDADVVPSLYEPWWPTTKTGYIATFGGHFQATDVRASGAFDITIYEYGVWENRVVVEETPSLGLNRTAISLYRSGYVSDFYVTYENGVFSNIAKTADLLFTISEDKYPVSYALKGFTGKWYNETFFDTSTSPGDEPTDPDQTIIRTGSVTMTDHNGTSITGFEVTAVNHYTGEEYTVSTDTDVAVITLPMDRTTEIRNPQTGVYEEAPVGYYTFYGQKPGYKMLNEDGIRVRVMPEKYGSYKLCDILVTSESGPLTGKHQFQIRSRADFSILQTGIISAKSRTTGIWYNTTVVDGLATLILPYDTSDAISKYAGHYYVYATSPGYEDSDYGTQIAVYPHTVSEIRTILLTPIGGVPTPGNVTLRIQAISETGQGVTNADIFIAGVIGAGKSVWDTYTASSTGYLEVSVPGNSTYDIVASGAGYYDSARRIEVFTEDPPLIEIKLYLSGAPTLEPTTEPTGWVTGPPTTQPTGGIPDEDDDSDGFMMQAVRGIANLFGVSFGVGKTILGMLLALGIGTATAKQLKGGAQEFGMGMLGGVVLGVLIGLLPIWVLVLLVLIVGLWIGQRYMSGGDS